MIFIPLKLPLVPMTPIFEWYEDRCGSVNWHKKNTCSKDIGLHVQNMLTILGSIVNIFEGRGYMNT